MGKRRRQPAGELSPGAAAEKIDAGCDMGALLYLRNAPHVSRVIETVSHVVKLAGLTCGKNFGVMFDHSKVERHCPADAMLVEHFEHSPQPCSITVVLAAVSEYIRMRGSRVGVTNGVCRRKVLVVLDIGNDPECDARPIGPFQDRAIANRRVADAVFSGNHAVSYVFYACPYSTTRWARANASRYLLPDPRGCAVNGLGTDTSLYRRL